MYLTRNLYFFELEMRVINYCFNRGGLQKRNCYIW